MRWKLVTGMAFIVIGGAPSLWYLRHRAIDVPVAQMERDVPVRVFGLGTIEAQISTRIGFEVAGTITEMLADHGDRVPAGTVLARLNAAAQEARVAKAEAGLQNAEALQGRATAALERATVLHGQRRTTALRRRDLASRGTTSPEQAELAETDAAAAAADMGVARADLEVARAGLADARAALLAERTALAKHTLSAPFDALIVARHREVGSALAPNEGVFTLVAPDSLWVLAHVDEARAGSIAEGQPAEVRLRSLPGEAFPARVVRIGLESDRVTEERRVYVRCIRCPAQPVLGEQATVEIEVARLPTARLVPEVAVEGFDGATGRVWIIQDGALQQREVRFVARTLDARLALDSAFAPELPVVIAVPAGAQAGRAARPAP